jgi:hypothetical protein
MMTEMHNTAVQQTLAARVRQQQERFRRLSPAERLAVMQQLVDDSWAVLTQNPAGVTHFLQRNYRARAIKYPLGAADQ